MNLEQTKQQVLLKLIRSDGRLNSPAIHSKKNNSLVQEVILLTSYLEESAPFSRRWWHVLNGVEIPSCEKCSKLVKWNNSTKKYPRFCCQLCAVTSEEASERTSKQFKGTVVPKERVLKSKQTRKQNGYYKDRKSTIEKLSKQKMGKDNPQYGKKPWNYGLFAELNPLFGRTRPDFKMCGEKNPQYGKPPSPNAGKGIKGYFNGIHFRSSLELFYLMFYYENNIKVESAEVGKFRVKYNTSKGNQRTYSPDFLVNEKTLVELKPENLHTNVDVKNKFESLTKTHGTQFDCILVGYKNIGQFIRDSIHNNQVDKYISLQILQIDTIQMERLRKNYADIIRSTF